MVMKMNKEKFIKEIEEKLNIDNEKAIKITNIFEDTFFIGKKGKEKIIEKLVAELDIDLDYADEIYNEAITIINTALKEKLKHPFKSID